MDLFENPIALAQHVRQLHQAVVRWRQAMRFGQIDESGPFIGKPVLTTREAFVEIRESKQPEPLHTAWIRWAFYLSEARANAATIAATAQAYSVERHSIERPEPMVLSLRELEARLLSQRGERDLWAELLSVNSARLRHFTLEQSVRRDELARRAGFPEALAVTLPDVDLSAWVERALASTDVVYRELAPTQLERWFDAALGHDASRGWPAHVSTTTVQDLLGPREWLEGLNLPKRALPKPIAATSFARALGQLGSALLGASAPTREPYVVAHDPYGLYRHATGALLARLTTSPIWQARELGLSSSDAREQARVMLLSELIALRVSALKVSIAERARRSTAHLDHDFAELSERCLGFCLPLGLAGILPRIRVNDGQRLIGLCLAVGWSRKLVAQFDTDWFRNPQAILAIRDTLNRVLPVAPTAEQTESCPRELLAEFEGQL